MMRDWGLDDNSRDDDDQRLAKADLFDRLELIESGLNITEGEALLQEIQCLEAMAAKAGFHVLAGLAANLALRLQTAPMALPADFLDRMRDSLEMAAADGADAPKSEQLAPAGAQRAA